MSSLSNTVVTPISSNRLRTAASCFSLAAAFLTSCVAPTPSMSGVFGIARMIGVSAPSAASIFANEMPAAIDSTSGLSHLHSASCGSTSAKFCGLTDSSTVSHAV